ncbi:aspartyl protease family protein [Candidatus Poriferisocius sp.]|uniref:aspartyl protease family protein n=1 Tax=Candidatus Poriferisocius sp. TaxID=3101276 RepID=UPI003B018C94
MPSLVVPVEDNNIIIPAMVELPHDYTEESEPESIICKALVDTGAQGTMVSRRIADQLNPPVIGYGTVEGVTGPAESPIHELRIIIPTEVEEIDFDGKVSERFYFYWGVLRVMILAHEVGEDIDILLGMDMLTRFHITMYRDQVIISS